MNEEGNDVAMCAHLSKLTLTPNFYGDGSPLIGIDPLGLCNIKIRCGRVRRSGLTLGWHCGVIAPDGSEYGLGGGDGSSGSTGNAERYKGDPRRKDPDQKEYLVRCECKSCDDVQRCIQNYHDTMKAPPYDADPGPNSNTYAHAMLKTCGCSTTTPPGATGWNYGF
jgi:hypothetical protein